MIISKINPKIDENYLTITKENLYFDRKSAKYDLRDLANEIASFANASGGVVAVGITDKGKIEGFNVVGIDKLNDCQKVVVNYLKTSPVYKTELIDVKNEKGEDDNIILFHIEPSINTLIRNNKDEVYLRLGDSSKKLTADQVRSLEYETKERDFETEIILDSSIEDVDIEILREYKNRIGATKLSDEEVLKARNFMRERDGKLYLTNAGMLLFGKNVYGHFPNARVRVIKFDGTEMMTGEKLNIIKEKTFETNLIRQIREAETFIESQLKDFIYLHQNGLFTPEPEYPHFAWFEGLINAVAHRSYANRGEHITFKIFDDRIEIYNPGGLGGTLTVDTMKTERYSRNPLISRTLTIFELVRELNEGVGRMYQVMKEANLKEPKYIDKEGRSLLLILENNIVEREKIRGVEKGITQNNTVSSIKDIENINKVWDKLTDREKIILQEIFNRKEVTSVDVAKIISKSKITAVRTLNKLIEKDLIEWTGNNMSDRTGKYKLK